MSARAAFSPVPKCHSLEVRAQTSGPCPTSSASRPFAAVLVGLWAREGLGLGVAEPSSVRISTFARIGPGGGDLFSFR